MPPSHLRAICFDCTDHHRVARFWAEVLGYAIHPSDAAAADEFVALMPAEGGLHLSFNRVPEAKDRSFINCRNEIPSVSTDITQRRRSRVKCDRNFSVGPKVVKNRVHLDINMPDGAEMQRLQRLGARVLQEIHDEAGRLKWTILADPEGNEFCAFPLRRHDRRPWLRIRGTHSSRVDGVYVRHGLDPRVGHVRRFCRHAGLIKSLVTRVMGLFCPMRALIGGGRSYDGGRRRPVSQHLASDNSEHSHTSRLKCL